MGYMHNDNDLGGLWLGAILALLTGLLIFAPSGSCAGKRELKQDWGTLREECYPNKTCKTEDLECISNICVEKK